MKLKLSALFTMALASFSALAGFENGNGGDALVCQVHVDGFRSRVILLDYWEAKDIWGNLDLGKEHWTVEQKVHYVLDRLALLDPDRAAKYKGWFATFEQESARKSKIVLEDIPDSIHVARPQLCEVKQLVVQKHKLQPWEKHRYIINQDLYKEMHPDHQAGMILHELVYREGIELNHDNSIFVRVFNSFLASEQIAKTDIKTYMNYVKDWFHFPVLPVTFNNDPYLMGSTEFYENGQLKKGINLEVLSKNNRCGVLQVFKGNNFPTEFYPDGTLKWAYDVQGAVEFPGAVCGSIHAIRVGFYPEGLPKKMLTQTYKLNKLPIYNNQIVTFWHNFNSDIELTFHPNGKVQEGWFAIADLESRYNSHCIGNQKFPLMTNTGQMKEYGCQKIQFDLEGRAITLPL